MKKQPLKFSLVDSVKKITAKCPLYTFFLPEEKAKFDKEIKSIEKQYNTELYSFVQQKKFTGSLDSSFSMPVMQDKKIGYFHIEGLGKSNGGIFNIETLRRSVGRVIKSAQQNHNDEIVVVLPNEKLFNCTQAYLLEQAIIAAQMASYHYDTFLSSEKVEKKSMTVNILVSNEQVKLLQKPMKDAQIIAESVNLARCWVDTPPSNLTPVDLAEKASSIAKKYGLGLTVFGEKEIKKMGMGGIQAVSAGSEIDSQLVILEYKCSNKNAPTIAFVGKGITFDSGGLSLKPPRFMETMKEDMSGAAAVIATMQAIVQLKPDINVIGLTPLSENLPSGKATKPGDIVTFYNGKTAEVRNTDAEGRLVLADALSYAVKHYKNLDAIIDIATLTGACAHALGPFFTGLMSQHENLSTKIKNAAKFSGDRVWPLPLDNDYKKAIKSPIADICNIGSSAYNAGTITAGFFLQNFVGDTPWAHLDIAGTAFDVPDISYYRKGATGVGVRLLTKIALDWKI